MTLRQRHTEGAILYEKKLKPFLKNMNDGKGELLVYAVVLYRGRTLHQYVRANLSREQDDSWREQTSTKAAKISYVTLKNSRF